MRVSKLNVLHLHLTDSESFPLQLRHFSEITKESSYSPQEIYTFEDIRYIVSYAQINGIVIIPEVDSPAHTRSWSNPKNLHDIDACRDYPKDEWRKFCYEPPCGQLDPTNPLTLKVVKGILTDVQWLFPAKQIHLGGDEAFLHCYDFKPSIKKFMKKHNIKDYFELQSWYRVQIKPFVESWRQKVYWFRGEDEGTKLQHEDNDIVQYWDHSGNYSLLERIKNDVILSTYDKIYLDCGGFNQLGEPTWCDPYKTWRDLFFFNPYEAKINKERILGVEAPLWAEVVGAENIHFRLWPRVNSLAERLWNVKQDAKVRDIFEKLTEVKKVLKELKIPSDHITTKYCELNIDDCYFDEEELLTQKNVHCVETGLFCQ